MTYRLLKPFSIHSLTECKNEGKPYIGLGFSTVFSERQLKDPIVTARLFRNPHVVFDARFSCQKAIRFFGIELVRQPAAQMARSIAHQSNVFWNDQNVNARPNGEQLNGVMHPPPQHDVD